MKQIYSCLAIGACLAALHCGRVSQPVHAETGLARHKQLYAVPTPGPVVIDGSLVAARAYWNNNSFSANVTRDVPHESRLEPAEWGTAVVE